MARSSIGVREARQNLSRYLDRVQQGESFEITEHGHPVAVLGPLPERMSAIDRLEAEGRLARRGTGQNLADLPPPRPWDGPPASQILDELREDRI